jgi:hypothetical protein
MVPRISPRDLEQLSAYIDGSLSPRAVQVLDTRLKAEPALAAMLQQLRTTRAMLRSAPQRRVPRSFVLSRQQAGQPVRAGLGGWNSFNFASAAASLLLVFTLIGDFSVNGFPALAASTRMAEPEAMMLEAPAAEDAAGATTPSEEPLNIQPAEPDEFFEETPAMKSGSPFASFIANYARNLEAGLGSVALLSGLIAIHRRKRG